MDIQKLKSLGMSVWQHSFEAPFLPAGSKPSVRLEIGRIDHDGGRSV